MAAEDEAAGAADAQPAKQDWGADEDDNALPPLSNMGWADDDEDELPPLDPTWANLPVPDSPKREKPPAAFKPRDDRGGAEPRGSVFSRLGDVGGNAWRRPEAPAHRGGPPDRGPAPSRNPPAREDARGRRREPENPHDWHREQMRLQEAERAARGEPARGERPKADRADRSKSTEPNANATPAEVVYLSRDAQRAAALAREEDAAWRLARVSLATFHATADVGPPPAPFAPSACREMLNALSEPPFAEGRLAPNARAAFAVVASPSKAGAPRSEEDARAVVGGVLAPLRHLLAHGVATPGGAAAGSTGAFIAEQMHTAAVKLLAAALEVLAGGEVTRNAVETAEGIARVREAVAAKLGGAPSETRAASLAAAGGGGAAVPGRGDKSTARGSGDKGGRGGRGDGPRTEPPKGPDRDRWEKKPHATHAEEAPRVGGRRSGEFSDRRRSLEEKPRPRADDLSAAHAARPRVVPKVVIRPSKEDHRRDTKPAPAPAKGPSAKASKTDRRDKKGNGPAEAAEKLLTSGSGSPVPSGGVFSRLEGTPSPLPAPAGGAGPKPPPGKPPAKHAVPSPKPAAELPHPKPAAGAPAAKPGKGGKGAGAPRDASKGEKKHGAPPAPPGDEWRALDEELERAAGKAGRGKGKERASGGKEARAGGKAGGAEKHAEKHDIPHPKMATPVAPGIPAPKPSPGTSPAPKPAPPKDELDAVLDEELAKAKKSRRPGGRGRGGK